MKKGVFFVLFAFFSENGYSNEQFIKGKIVDGAVNFYPNALMMIMAIILLSFIITILTKLSTKVYNSEVDTIENIKRLSSIPLTTASVVLVMGIGWIFR